jgi:hypothetical protein
VSVVGSIGREDEAVDGDEEWGEGRGEREALYAFAAPSRDVLFGRAQAGPGMIIILSWHPSPAAFCSHSELAILH